MKRIFFFSIFTLVLVFQTLLNAQTTYTLVENAGYWHEPGTWLPAGVPGPGDYVIVNSKRVIITGSVEIAGFTLDWGNSAGIIEFKGDGNPSLTVTGNSTWGGGIFEGGNGVNSGNAVNNTLLFTETSVVTMTDRPDHNFHYLDFGTHMINRGTIIFQGNGFVGGRGFSTLHNEGLFDIQGDGDFDGATFSGATFINTGTLRKSGGTGISTFTGWWTFENQNGTIEAQSGSLTYSGGGNFNDGIYNVSENAVLSLTGSTYIFSGTLSGSPEGVFSLNGNSAIISTDSANVTLNIQGTGFQFIKGTISGGGTLIIPEDALLVLPGIDYAVLNGGTTLLNQGTVKHFGTNAFRIQGNSIVDNQSLWDITSDADFSDISGSGGTFKNTGTLLKSGGIDITSFDGGWDFQNQSGGVIDIETGEIEFTTSGKFENAQGGLINGVGIIDVPLNFTNNGIVSPGNSAGLLSYIGNFLPSNTAVLDVQLGGLNLSEYDQLIVTGSAKLNGTLKVYLTNGFIPAAGDSFVVLTTTSAITDSFVTFDIQSGLYLSIKKHANNVTLVVDSVGTISSLENETDNRTITSYELSQNYPNPFNPSTTIQFALPQAAFVSLEVFNIVGERVDVLVSQELNSGKYNYEWNGLTLTSGVYFYRLQAGSFVETKKMLLLK